MTKSQTTGFLLLLFHIGKFIFCQKIYIWKTQFVLLHLQYGFFTQQVIGNAVTPMPLQIFIGFVDAILLSKTLGNRLGILTQILIAIIYFFYLYISDKYLQFRKKGILIWAINFIIKSIMKEIKILVKHLFSFFIIVFSMKLLVILVKRLFSFSIIEFSMKLLVILFIRKEKTFVWGYFWFTPYKQPDLLTAELFFKLCIPQRHVHNLEKYWRKSVFNSVKNFVNL